MFKIIKRLISAIWRHSPREIFLYMGRRGGFPLNRPLAQKNGRSSFYLRYQGVAFNIGMEPATKDHEIEDWFVTSDGRRLPVYRNYRYSVKKGWQAIAPLKALGDLEALGLLKDEEIHFVKEAVGHRTITRPINEISEIALPILRRHSHLFIPGSLDDGTKPLLVTPDRVVSQAIDRSAGSHKRSLDYLAENGLFTRDETPRALDVGFGSGYASIAWERCGFEVVAIDNEFGESEQWRRTKVLKLKSRLRSDVRFDVADITTRTKYDDDSFDLIYSGSVLEHIVNLPDAIKEMSRLLRPGGVMVHNYNPFYGYNGAHALGIPDTPWGHTLMSAEDTRRYFWKFRPHEAKISSEWTDTALTRDYPIAKVQELLSDTGFHIHRWLEIKSPKMDPHSLTPEIVREALRINPGITISDLLASGVSFIARKPH